MQICNKRILILVDEPEKMTEGGIALPDVSKEKPLRATVINIDPNISITITIGTKLYFPSYAGCDLKLKLPDDAVSVIYKLIKEEDVLMIEDNHDDVKA